MNGYLLNPLVYLLTTFFTLYIAVVMLRVIFQLIRADFYNPFSQFVVKVTAPLLIPMRRLVPAIGRFDTAAFVLMVGLQIILQSIIQVISGPFSILYVIFVSLANLINIALYIFTLSIFITIIASWINPGAYNPMLSLVQSIGAPIVNPIRRWFPPVSGIDFSSMIALVLIEVARMLLIPPFYALASG